MNFSEYMETRVDKYLEENCKLHQDSDSGITWYEDSDEDRAYDFVKDEVEEEIDEEFGINSLVILSNGKFYMQRIRKLDKFNKKGVAAIIQNNNLVYTNGYFRFVISNKND